MMPIQIIRLPGRDGSFNDFLAIAPTDMTIDDAVQLANAVISKKNEEYEQSDTGDCDDGLSVEASICAELASMGFGIGKEVIDVHETNTWDGSHEFDSKQKAILAAYEAKNAISAVLSKTLIPKI